MTKDTVKLRVSVRLAFIGFLTVYMLLLLGIVNKTIEHTNTLRSELIANKIRISSNTYAIQAIREVPVTVTYYKILDKVTANTKSVDDLLKLLNQKK